MHRPTRPPIERARHDVSITVLPGTRPSTVERHQVSALAELLHRSREHVLGGQRWAASAHRPALEDACRRGAVALGEALAELDLADGPPGRE